MRKDKNEKSLTVLQHLEKPLDAIGSFGAYLTLLLILVLYLNNNFAFIPDDITVVLYCIREIAIIAVIICKGLEFALYRGFIATVIFLALSALVIAFMFFPASIAAYLPA